MTYLEIAGLVSAWLVVVVLIVSLFWINDETEEE